jgi:arginine-tRNA-protein transferase
MESLFQFVAPPSQCGYLPHKAWQLEYVIVGELSAAEYANHMRNGWRRFGHTLFRPRCRNCNACQSLRILAEEFRPNRSQRRCRKANEGVVQLRIGTPSASRAKLDLYDRYHSFQSDFKNWPLHAPKDVSDYIQSFVENPFPTQEWCYYLGDRLVGVGYVDALDDGLSGIYFFYDPEERSRGLGTWNILSLIEQAARQRLPYVYLGYYVAECRSLAYKSSFVPNQVLDNQGQWRDYRVTHSE